jgi:hypothetical protein
MSEILCNVDTETAAVHSFLVYIIEIESLHTPTTKPSLMVHSALEGL